MYRDVNAHCLNLETLCIVKGRRKSHSCYEVKDNSGEGKEIDFDISKTTETITCMLSHYPSSHSLI